MQLPNAVCRIFRTPHFVFSHVLLILRHRQLNYPLRDVFEGVDVVSVRLAAVVKELRREAAVVAAEEKKELATTPTTSLP